MTLGVSGKVRRFHIAGYTWADAVTAFRPDGRALRFAMRTTAAAFLALLIGHLLGFHAAYWSAITAWVLAVPDRGVILPKAFFRTLGTLIGAAAAIAVLPLAGQPMVFVATLSAWVGLCAGVACLLRRFQAYAAQLAGYTATIVAVVALDEPQGHSFDSAIERVALVLIGIGASALLAFLFAEPIDAKRLQREARQWAGRTIRWAAKLISELDPTPAGTTPNRDLWIGLSDFESACEYAAFESSVIRQRLPAIRRLTAAELSLVATARALRRLGALAPLSAMADIRAQLARVVDVVVAGRTPGDEIAALRAAAEVLSATAGNEAPGMVSSAIGERANDLADALERIARDLDFLGGPPSRFAPAPLAVHADWRASTGVGLRAALATFAIGALWQYLAWAGGSYAFIFTSIACLLFGVQPRPVVGITRFAFGVGCAALVFIAWHAIPGAGSHGPAPTLAVVAILTFLGAIGLANRFIPALDFNANFTGLMLGAGPTLVAFGAALEQSANLAAGIALAYLAFATPVTGPRARENRLNTLFSETLKDLAGSRWRPLPHKWEAVMYDQLNRWALAQVPNRKASTGLRRCLLTLDMGLDLLRLQTFLRSRVRPPPAGLMAVINGALDDFARQGITETAAAAMERAATAAMGLAGALSDPAEKRLAVRSAAAMDVIARCCRAWIAGER